MSAPVASKIRNPEQPEHGHQREPNRVRGFAPCEQHLELQVGGPGWRVPMTPSIDTRVDSMTFRMTAPLASWWVHRGHRCWAADRIVRLLTRGSVRPVMRPAASDCEHLYPQLRTDELLGEAARLAWGEVPGLPQPMDCVGKGLTQDAGLNLQFVAGLGVIAAGIAVDDPDALGAPGQSRPQSALH